MSKRGGCGELSDEDIYLRLAKKKILLCVFVLY